MNGATRDDLKRWFKEGVKQGALRMVVVCDMFDWTDFPRYSDHTGPKLRMRWNEGLHGNAFRVMEVYDLTRSFEEQAGKFRCFNW